MHSTPTLFRRSRQLAAAAAIPALLLAMSTVTHAAEAAGTACRANGVTVASAGGQPAAPVAPDAFDEAGVAAHFAAADDTTFLAHESTTFSCVDSRGQGDVLGTPGGDLSELAAGAAVYLNLTGAATSNATGAAALDLARAVVGEFAASGVVTEARPLYLHTSDEKLRSVFKDVAAAGVRPQPTVLPLIAPANETEREIWLRALSAGKAQGCGHLRLAIDRWADYGFASPELPSAMVRAFYEYWWPTPADSKERNLTRFEVLQGPLSGKAVAIIAAEGCPNASPAFPPSVAGSQVFEYHAAAVKDFRDKVLAPFFVTFAQRRGHALDAAAFAAALNDLAARQLAATLKYLEPANALPLWAVTVKAT